MDLVALGTVALDSVESPFGRVEDVLGGSATYFSLAARKFCECGIVSVVGEDFPEKHADLLSKEGVDLSGLITAPGKTFRWSGYYEYDMNQAHTKKTDLNVLADFKPKIPKQYLGCSVLFLANTDPAIQNRVLGEVKPDFSVLDTMDFWIQNKREDLDSVLSRVDLAIINDGEARMYCDTPNLVSAGRKLLEVCPRIIIKKGEHGSLFFSEETFFALPAYPLKDLLDPTGAGDSFAGATVGHLVKHGKITDDSIKKSMVCGAVVASYTVEDFSVNGLLRLDSAEIEERYNLMRRQVAFDHVL